jgi:hypothetical protein
MKTSSVFAATLLLLLIPCAVCAKERGTVVDIWEQRDFYARHYIYQVETETHVYEFLGNYPRAFQPGDSITFTFDKDHQHALVTDGSGKKTKLLLISEGTRNPN